MRRRGRSVIVWSVVAVVGMAIVQFLVADAWNIGDLLYRNGHRVIAMGFLAFARIPGLSGINWFWQSVMNYPRNVILGAVGIVSPMATENPWAVTDRAGWGPPLRDATWLLVGSLVLYLPIIVFLGRLRTRGDRPRGDGAAGKFSDG